MVGHPAVRPSYNLCHEFLTGNGDKAMETLRAVAPEALRVSINGVDPADRKRYILTLDEGSFDIAAFLAELKRLGYRGPVGHQFYNIPGEPEVNLKKAMEAWRKVQPK
jgi:sugar phosphate isomerase/epimerase